MSRLLSEQFLQLDLLLARYRAFWRFSPFHFSELPWDQTALAAALQQLGPEQIERLDLDESYRRDYFSVSFPELNQLSDFERTSFHHTGPIQAELPFWFSRDIKGRKFEQIQAFAAEMQQGDLPVLEWCAGKGHLGRWLCFSQERKVTSLEWQHVLCAEGQLLAEQLKLSQHFIQADVLAEETAKHLNTDQQVIALHACGDLHIRLLQQASRVGTAQLDIVPCCYHLIATEQYQALSSTGAAKSFGANSAGMS